MATYIVNITGSTSNSLAYAILNGVQTTNTGTTTYTSKPTVAVYVDANAYAAKSNCKVTLNGTTVKTGSGTYTADIGDADTVNIKFSSAWVGSYIYFTCDITTETTPPPDPTAPHDGHNTNISGVAREIEGGTVRLNGVVREIESGWVLVNGVTREISIAAKMIPFDIPVLSANGTLGGAAFAVYASNENSSPYAAYKSFDGLDSTGYSSGINPSTTPISFVIYFPTKVFLESISVKNMGSGFTSSSPKNVTLGGSNDGQSWETITTVSNTNNTNGSSWAIQGSLDKAYSYFRLYITSCNTTNPYVNMGEITLTAFTAG